MRTILYIVLIFLVYRLVKGYLYQRRGFPSNKGYQPFGDEMVFDPSCQSYIPKDSALRVKDGDTIHYFCSEECRGRFLARM